MEQEITYKKCSKCGEEKPATDFNRNKARGDNLSVYCKICSYNYNKKRYKKERKLYYEKNKESFIEKSKLYYQENKKHLNKKSNINRKRKRQEDIIYKLTHNFRGLLYQSFLNKNWGKKTQTQDYLKCDWETFKEHIESQFIDGMSWDNYGEWHLDHYYPVSLAQTEEDMYIFNHYTNFQPLCAEENISKSNNVPDGFEEWYEMMRKKVL